MRNSIFYSALTDENGNILVDENGNKLLAEIGITDTEVFQNLTQAYMPKNEKIIKDIIIQIDDDITVEQLSEGEKKLILVKTVLEILSDEIAVHLPKYILGQFFGKLCHIMIAIPSSWCGIELGVNGSLLKVRPNILFLNFIAPSFLARSLAGHLAAFE